jgi:hypothetical protein
LSPLYDAPDLLVRHSGSGRERAQRRPVRIREMQGGRQLCPILQYSLGEQTDSQDEHLALPVTLRVEHDE